MNLQDVSHIHIPDGDVRMIHDSDNRLLWGAVGYNVLFSGNTYQQSYTGKNLLGLKKPSSNTFGFEPVVAEESGTITVNGTFTGGGGGFPWISDRQLSIPAGTYTFSMKNPQSFNVSLRMFDAQGQYTSGKYIAAGATSGTFTLEYDCVRVAILIGAFSAGKTLNNQKFEELQLEAGSTATSFEPFVGGQPSPSPDYPQPIQTVTGEQTVVVTGKNLLNLADKTATERGVSINMSNSNVLTLNGTATSTGDSFFYYNTDIKITQDSVFNGSFLDGTAVGEALLALKLRIVKSDSSVEWVTARVGTPLRLLEGSTITQFYLGLTSGTVFSNYKVGVQLEYGSTATAYAPYHATNYPISLGSIELCKIGDYQDYIYKDGDDWKVHKAIKKVELDEQSGWTKNQYGTNSYKVIAQDISTLKATVCVASQFFTGVSYGGRTTTTQNIVFADSQPGIQTSDRGISIRNTPWSDTTSLLAWVASNQIIVYYLLLTPTDTTITNANLIAQLDAIYNLVRRYGYNFVVSASGNNLPIIIDRTLL